MHACLIDMWCGNHEQRTYPPDTQFLPADGVANILERASFTVARHFSREQIGSTCGHVAVGVVSQCAAQLAEGKAVNDLSFNVKKAACMKRIIEASRGLGEGKALARNATDAEFLGNLEIEALVGSADVQQKLAAARIASAVGTPSCELRCDAPRSGATFMEHVTTVMRRRLQSGSEKGTIRMMIVNDSYGGAGIHWWTAVVYLGPCGARPIPRGPMGLTDVVELGSDDDSPDDSGGRVAGKVDDAQQTSAGAGASADRRERVVRSESQTAARTKVQVPDKLGGGWIWIRRLLSLLNGGARVSKERLVRSKHGGTCDEGGGGTKAADSGTMIRHFDFVVVVYEIGEDGKSERTWKWYLAQVQRMYKVHEKGGRPTKYMDPVALGEAGVHLRLKLLGEAPVKRVGSSLRDPCCFMLEGLENEEHDAIPIHTVLAKVSFSSVEEEEGDGGEPTLRYYISREDRDYFNKLTQEICDSVVKGEQQDSEASASRPGGKRKRAVKLPEEEAEGAREAILRKLPKPTNSARPVQLVVQRSGRVSRKPVDVYSALHCA